MTENESSQTSLVASVPFLFKDELRRHLQTALDTIEGKLHALSSTMQIAGITGRETLQAKFLLKLAIETTTQDIPPPVIRDETLSSYVRTVIVPLLPQRLLGGAGVRTYQFQVVPVLREIVGGLDTSVFYQ